MSEPSSTADLLACVLETSKSLAGQQWLETLRATRADARFEQEVLASYAAAGRRLLAAIVSVDPEQAQRLEEIGLPCVRDWSAARVGRALLLLKAVPHVADAAAFVAAVYRTGDNDERIALLGVLAALEGPERLLATAVEACRTHVTSIFEAIACRNPYPATHFSEQSFNQMVLKAIFLDVPTAGIVGLERRHNPELVRMAEAYASERRAAGRSVPDDVFQILSLQRIAS